MVDPRGRDMGEPTIEITIRQGTPEEAACNRERLQHTLQHAYTYLNGYPTKVEVLWGDALPK